MNWAGWDTSIKPTFDNAVPINPLDALSQDELLLKWDALKADLAKAKEAEMEMRKYIVSRAFPDKHEGTNILELGNGYELKAGIKFNYSLADNKTVENCLDRIALIGNQGSFIAERLVSWKPSFLLTEYRNLQEQEKDGDSTAKAVLTIVHEMLTIKDAAPSLIKAPKGKKK